MLKQLSFLALAGQALAQNTPTLAQALNSTAELSQLAAVLGLVPELVATLSGAHDITILAPSNNAFAQVPNATLQSLTSDTATLSALLTYHVLNGTYPASSISSTSAFVPTLLTGAEYTNVTDGQVVEATLTDGGVKFFSGFLNNSTVTTADVHFTGGVIHIIDSVLTIPGSPSDTLLAAELTSLAGALTATELVDVVDSLPDVTIFAPSNAAFQAIGSGLGNLSVEDTTNILTYHVINGTVGYSSGLENGTVLTAANGATLTITINDGGIFVNSARVITPDVLVANGVVHVIDAVLNPSNASIADPSATAGAPAFSGASSVSEAPFTSGLPGPSGSPTPASPSSQASEVSTAGAAAPMKTGSIGMSALLGAAAVYFL